ETSNAGSTAAKILSRGKLRVGIRQDAKPFGFIDSNGQTVGFDIDLARELARRWLGSADALELVKVSPADRIPRLAAGEVDLLIAAMSNQRERDALIDFSQTYYMDGQSLLVRDDAGIRTFDDLQGKTVAVLQDASIIGTLQNEANRQKLTLTTQGFPDYATALDALKTGNVDALAADSVTLSQIAQNSPGLEIVEGRLTREPYNIGVPQGDSDLRNMVNFTLQDIKIDGTYDKLYQRWFPTDQPLAIEISPGLWPYSFDKLPHTPVIAGVSRIETILKRGKLVAGIHTKFPPFSDTAGTGERSGFDIDILREFARRWLGDENAIEFVPGEPNELVGQVSAGKLDLAAAALVQQRNWAAQIDFSQTYVGAPLASQPLSIGLPHNDYGFRELVNVTLQEMKSDGAYDTIYNRWFGKDSPQFALEIIPGDANYLLLPQQDEATTPRVTAATESTISRIRQRGNQLVVGVASDMPPFGQQGSQNQLVGFDPDLVQAMAKAWGLTVQLVPVTAADRIQKLVTGEVDMLAAAMPRSKDEEARIDFSQTYFVNGQRMLVLQDSGLQTMEDLAGRTLAVLENSKAGDQIQAYADAKNVQIAIQPYPTYEAALVALHTNQVAAIIGDNVALLQFAKTDPSVTIVGEMFTYEPYGLGLPSGDSYFNNLVNITLQTLKQQGVYDQLYRQWFGATAAPYAIEILPGAWRYSFADSPTTLDKPVRSKVEQILTNRQLVAGVLYDLKPFGFLGADNQPEGFDVDIMREFAKRWLGDANAVVFVPVTAADRIQKLAAGEVDIVAASMTHKRERDESIDFSQTYFQDGQSLLVRADAGITNLGDLNGKTVATIAGSASVENIQSAANARAISINILPFQEYGQALQALKAGQVDAVTATRAALAQFAKDNPGLTVVNEQFTSEPYGLGVPNYDGRFQDLVNFTLQEMKSDGTYDRLYHTWFGSDTPFTLEVWPGKAYLDLDMIPMVHVPAGEYIRGNHTGFPDEKTEQLLHIDDFYMDEYEVTNRQYAQCVQAGQCTSPRLPRSVNFANYYTQFDFANFPAIWVAWPDAEAYCAYRGKRLPTEAEWEKAARGPQDTLYPWGNEDPTNQANYNYAARDVAPVGTFPADRSGYGAYDMAGNVREWVADWYQWDYYPNAPTQNPTGPASGVTRVLRGGSWNDIALYLRSTVRKNFLPDSFDSNLGFRCASSTFPPAQ
ncbi:MAG: transporter substrate-binding domain-containing protein, partial [Chloroflexi bacterium]|nr:transporter substrate-binding domain-containing protein [Chloroflexota bacterium]